MKPQKNMADQTQTMAHAFHRNAYLWYSAKLAVWQRGGASRQNV